MVGSGANVYGGVDWVAMGMSAAEDADLRDPQARRVLARPVAGTPPASSRGGSPLLCCRNPITKHVPRMQAWTLSNGLGNPASLYSNEMRLLFDAAFKGDYSVRKSILDFDHSFLQVLSHVAAHCR